ncbi:hypothetical protein [Novosphingobium sp. THN1]|uniref:hypothetical protein n=1 Tax=Novosphingobium sp. THN1 TaxID=1016987 RepID=UPI001F07B71D|nr:hypothetical protein [Novosphingobium sp. THN1]
MGCSNNIVMFVVERVARGHRYLYLVESVREGKVVRQRTIKALGRKDVLAASGELDRLASSIARHAERSVILSDIDAGKITAQRIGGVNGHPVLRAKATPSVTRCRAA